MEFKFNIGDSVIYKKDNEVDKLATIFKKRSNKDSPKYLIYIMSDKTAEDMVDETLLTSTSIEKIVDSFWDKFVYTGDNLQASNYIIDNILKNINNAQNISWGPNEDNTLYTLNIKNIRAWLKPVTVE
jgi:phosphoenolpyruvate synthase/pyruvate phosphate dikinase